MRHFDLPTTKLEIFCYYPFTQGLRPLCLPYATTKPARSPLKAQRRPGSLTSGIKDVQTSPWTTWSPWVCSKLSHKGRRGGRLLTGRSKETGGRHTHRRDRRMNTQGSAIGRSVKKNAHCCKHCVSICAMLPPPLCHHSASFGRPRATTEPLQQFSFVGSRNAQGSCCSNYTETDLSGFGRLLSVLVNFLVNFLVAHAGVCVLCVCVCVCVCVGGGGGAS